MGNTCSEEDLDEDGVSACDDGDASIGRCEVFSFTGTDQNWEVPCFWGGRIWLSTMWRSNDVARLKVGESWSVAEDRTAVSVLPPLAMTLLDAMNWRDRRWAKA